MTDGYVYAVASGKGGVGKSTSAINLGAAFVEAGRKVVVVDVDLGMANLADLLSVEPADRTLHDVLAGEGELEEAITGAPGGFDVILGSSDIDDFGEAEPAGLRDVVADLREQYDVVVLDGGGGLSHDVTVPLGLADGVILVSTPSDAAITNAKKTRDLVDRLDGRIVGVIVTRLGGAGRATTETVSDSLDLDVLGAIPEDGAVQMSVDEGTPLVTIDRDSPAAQSYREIAYSLLDEPLPRDWAHDTGMGSQPVPSEQSPTDESATSASEPVESEPADDEETGGTPMGDHPQQGMADTLESMEDESQTEVDSMVDEAESDDESTPESEQSGGFLSRLFGGLFG